MRPTILKLVRCLLLAQGSLLGALTARFLWDTRGETPFVFSSYLSSLYYAGFAIRNSFIFTVVIGGVVFYLHERQRARRSDSLSAEILDGSVALTGLYASLLFVALALGRAFTFPRWSWVAAWAIALSVFFLAKVTHHLESSAEQHLRLHPGHMLLDGAISGSAFLAAYLVRFDASPSEAYQQQAAFLVVFVVVLYVGSNYLWDVYSLIWRFTSLRETLIIAQAIATAASLTFVSRILILERLPALRVPLGVLVVHPLLTFVAMLGIREARRIQYRYRSRSVMSRTARGDLDAKKVLLIGAGEVGQQLVRDLQDHPDFKVVGFLDDDPTKRGRRISGIRVLGNTGDLSETTRWSGIDEVILSMPSAPSSAIKRVVASCEKLEIPTLTVPALREIVQRRVSISRLRPVRMEDLLGRAHIDHGTYDPSLEETYHQRSVLVTGAAGSIGSELVRQLKEFQPSALLILDRDENGLYEIELEIRDQYRGPLDTIVADVRNRNRMESVFSEFHPEVIFHAAAYKHVPLMELHPPEAILNNVIGTQNLAELACRHQAQSFVLISTDKAVNPSSVMGASKRIAEIIVQRMAKQGPGTRLCCVRFGNVLGSRASVVPLFRKQIAEGKNLTVTHPDVQRYFMTIPEAVQLLIQAGSLGRDGDVFVLDMGDPVRIVDLARDLIELSGLEIGKDIEIEYTGLRPGEKLSEELLVGAENGIRDTRYPKILIAEALEDPNPQFGELLHSLEEAALDEKDDHILQILKLMEIGYRPLSRHTNPDGRYSALISEPLSDLSPGPSDQPH